MVNNFESKLINLIIINYITTTKIIKTSKYQIMCNPFYHYVIISHNKLIIKISIFELIANIKNILRSVNPDEQDVLRRTIVNRITHQINKMKRNHIKKSNYQK